MNNEPVAWFEQDENMKSIWYQTDKDAPNSIPLYTHPVKELGYNDIMETWWKIMPNAKSCEGVFEFAKAILRKAQEK